MSQEFISKRELLEKYSISYGALYRWKRMGLIPEEWFIKRSTVTGQETFFPKDLICERMELILSQKDTHSLENLAKQFGRESQKQAALIIETSYGRKIFYLKDIHSVFWDEGNGDIRDITENLKKL